MIAATFKKENDDLLKFILNKRFFEIWKNHENTGDWIEDSKHLIKDSRLEIYLTAKCNQSCEYCYLAKYQDKLYPAEYDNKENILKNLQILYNWIIENNLFIPVIEFYSGEIWHTDFGLEVLDITYDFILKKGLGVGGILIPSNCSFLRNERAKNLIQRRINRFEKIQVPLQFSISVDGKIVEDMSRPLNNKNDVKDDEFYEQMFLFAKYNNFYFHPMVSSSNVNKWIENYKWWKKKLEEYDMPEESIMMLEVRNDDWTEDSINEYKKFLDYLLEEFIQNYGVQLLSDIVVRSVYANQYKDFIPEGYFPFLFFEGENAPGCSIANHLTIRIGDLAICPCHRTAYNKYLYGKFIVKDNKIIDIESNNTQMAIRILFCNNRLCSFKCDTCVFKDYCLQGCFGAQLEANKDPFICIESVCDFFEQKYVHLIKKYIDYGVIDLLAGRKPHEVDYIAAKKFLNLVSEVEKKYGLGKN